MLFALNCVLSMGVRLNLPKGFYIRKFIFIFLINHKVLLVFLLSDLDVDIIS